MSAKPYKLDIRDKIKNIGIFILILGIAQLLVPQLGFFWGIILIAIGLTSFFYKSANMLVVFGIALLGAGLLNLSGIFFGDIGFWAFLGVIQIIWGIQEILRFRKAKILGFVEPKRPKERRAPGKEFIWVSLRVSFYLFIILYAYQLIYVFFNLYTPDLVFSTLFGIVQFMLAIFIFVVSIIHLVKFKKKSLAVIALIVSSLSFILVIISLVAGFMIGLAGGMEYISGDSTYEYYAGDSTSSDYVCSFNYYDCADFNTQAEAQYVYHYCGPEDVHWLDDDKDGIACEWLD